MDSYGEEWINDNGTLLIDIYKYNHINHNLTIKNGFFKYSTNSQVYADITKLESKINNL
jgi:hypothetical protein